jgi:hypothetical protein
MPASYEVIVKQIDEVLEKHRAFRARSKYDDCSDQPKHVATELLTLMCAAVERLAPSSSQYVQTMRATLKTSGEVNAYNIPHVAGILGALRTAYVAGYLETVAELIHADLFAGFLEMADYLLTEGYKDAAAVIVGSVLEEHLRQLCAKRSITTLAGSKQKKADALNNELGSNGAYSKLDQKSVTAWLDMRNKAAHGHYGEYTKDQASLVLQCVRDFMARVPA